ncbi:hypothetical protein PKNFJJPA_00013 [Salmonella phage vB_SenAc_BPS6]|uniref:Uncharacterized protein n=29 Tax=Caudoviricetes TaxID=2731619 RepID=A0A7T8IUZ0_9CAUD|nr:hypothetical protein FF15_gp007 [Salmonella phage vB-SalM-SJ3]YP_009140255.1 hypothetical protein DET7_78 [Salmonella phage Det7]YP_009881189.1 hypothetical protein HYP68_gp172 [Salmonella phage SenASZ3]YP_009881857.1 hypothetical protein HYP72_gp081 [Salmonella phage SeSz-1]YP_009887425.1 hypothetical protein HYQ29_gp088 [Salmonella phage rabagast]YP_009887618.1 hypothetical protein HYQ30_gp093 [Salmonella phage heyday]YP_009888410.1 hypothetical protein HYQ34_gp088 [Salmonella phage dink
MMDLKELNSMDDEEILRGYMQAREGYVLSGLESKSFIHGWRNGMVDFGGCPITEEQMDLARQYLKKKPT